MPTTVHWLASLTALCQQSSVRNIRIPLLLTLLSPTWIFAQTTLPRTRPGKLSEPQRQLVTALSHRAVDYIDQRAFPDAERALNRALQIDPENATCLFNLACVHAAMRKPDAALDDLRRATAAGFTDFTHIENDPVFVSVRGLQAYRDLLARKAEITHAAGQRIVAELKDFIGDKYVFDVDEKRKFVFAVRSPSLLKTLEKSIDDEADSLGDFVFSHPSDEFIRIVMATPSDFAKIETRPGVGGYYDDSARMLLVHRPGAELRHEFVHALHAADQHALGQVHPIWLSEGLATLYESPRTKTGDKSKLLPNDTWRLAEVQAAGRRGTLLPLEELVKMKRGPFTNRADLAYGQANGLLMYLYDHDMLKSFYTSYTEHYAEDPTGRAALERITGKTLKNLQPEWIEWLATRTPPSKRD
jgi:uncharacterized protein DUF1570